MKPFIPQSKMMNCHFFFPKGMLVSAPGHSQEGALSAGGRLSQIPLENRLHINYNECVRNFRSESHTEECRYMHEIKCPNCGEVFQVDETGYQQIAHQVRDEEFMKELKRREEALNAVREEAAKVALAVAEKILRRELSGEERQQEYIEKLVDETKEEMQANRE
jgi:hypothetical protein